MKFLAVFILALATASAFETAIPLKDLQIDEEIVGRITNGQTAKAGQFPYQVFLSLGNTWCGGSLISNQYVLTAAHCLQGNTQGGTAWMGSITRSSGTGRAITAIIRHTGYNPSTLHHDITILKIQPVSMSSTISTIKLPAISSSYSTYEGVTATISGWGKTSDSSDYPSTLQYTTTKIISNAQCAQTFGNIYGGSLCSSTTGARSTCSGDSGGPAVYNGQQIGITSYVAAAGCAKGYPAGFVRVTYYREWIRNAVGV